MGMTISSSFLSSKPAKIYVYGCFLFSRFSSFYERSSLDKGQESSSMRLNKAKGEADEVLASLRMPLGTMRTKGCAWMLNRAVKPRVYVLSLESRYGLGLVKVKDNLA
ncbi:hypothetical protein PIB30_093013 [Stylosanthes scabra]|uniref:Uncharacterized protein n=1 Tax=Stylosanthes scabra TaxID=79078 RepID=A0ABU6WTB3_9FABA|nr:hypothetical protein [Stylosanthes scabra]